MLINTKGTSQKNIFMQKKILELTLILCLGLINFKGYTRTTSSKQKFQVCRLVLNDVNFCVDPRIELFHTVKVLSGIPLVNFIDLDYKQKILNNFSAYKDHPLFGYLKRNSLYGKVFDSIDAPIWAMLHLTNEFEWRKDVDVPEARDSGIDSLRVLMKDFAKKSDYVGFFNKETDFFRISLATLTYNLPDFNEKQRLTDYCRSGKGKNIEFNVILNFLGWEILALECIRKTVQSCMR